METQIIKKPICIIGAGMAGLTAAHKLKQQDCYDYENILILEAASFYGGRIRKLNQEKEKENHSHNHNHSHSHNHNHNKFSDFDIELGGEEIHGKDSEFYEMVVNTGGILFNYWDAFKFYTNYGNEILDVEEVVKKDEHIYSDLKFVWDLFEDISYEFKNDYPDVTLREFLDTNSVSKSVYYFANAMIGTEAGTDLDNISIKGFCDLCKIWKSGVDNYLLTNMAHVDVLTKAYSDVLQCIRYNTNITKVDYSESNLITLTDDSGNLYQCENVVITIPVTQLRKLSFTPTLPVRVDSAISALKMDSAAKVILKFKDCFWPKDTAWILIEGAVNVYWPTVQGKNSQMNIITGMAAGENCRALNKLYKSDRDQFIDLVLKELEQGLRLDEGVLKNSIEDFVWWDWTDVPFIEGAYTYSAVGEKQERSILRESIENRIFFAGEATADFGHFGTMHGALESGIRAAEQIIYKNTI